MSKHYQVIFLLFLATNLAAQTIPGSKWEQDIAFFKQQLVKRHKNAFHHVSQAEYEKDIDQLSRDLPRLKDYQVIVRLMQITAKVGDGHTGVHLPTAFKRYPIHFVWFGDELRVVAVLPGYEQLLGLKLVAIDDHNLEAISQGLATVLSQDENTWYALNTGAIFLSYPEILHTIGVAKDYERARYVFADDANKEIALELPTMPFDPQARRIPAVKTPPLFRQQQTNPFWFTYLKDINAVFVSFKKYDDINKNISELFDFMKANNALRLVVDMRLNDGGDFYKGRRLIERIAENSVLNQKGHLFVICGRRTYSAAMVNTIDFKKMTNAIILGEPPGEKPNSYSENDEMTLPNSKLVISYSTRYYKFLDEDVDAFEPDVRIETTWADWVQGRDAVLEWITDYCKNG
jgi:hypothetical protein